MTEASLRDMGGSRDSLRQAIGRLDTATPPPTGRASAAKVRPPVVRPARSGRWVFLLVLLAVSAAGVASLLAT